MTFAYIDRLYDEKGELLVEARVHDPARAWYAHDHDGSARWLKREHPDGRKEVFHVYPAGTRAVALPQGGVWVTRQGVAFPVDTLDPDHARNILTYLERNGIPEDLVPNIAGIRERASIPKTQIEKNR